MPANSQTRTALPRVEGDRIVPMHLFDDTTANGSLILSITLCFDQVLDADQIHSALVRLLHIGEWKKLGGRLRKSEETGRLEIHIPSSFTSTRPAVRYHHENFASHISEHPVVSQLPRSGHIAKTTGSIWDSFSPLTLPPGGPQSLNDYLSRDEPQLSLRINSFHDATLVSLNFLHTVADAQGVGTILKAWSAVVAGKEAIDVPEKICGIDEDVFARFGSTAPKEQLALREKWAGSLELKVPEAGNEWDALTHADTELRTIFLPSRVVNSIRSAAIADVTGRGFPSEVALRSDPSKPFLSEGDVLISWISRHALAETAPSTPQPVTIINVYDTRDRAPSAFDAKDGERPVYVGNATLWGHIYVSSSLVTSAPLGDLAAAIRAQLVQQTTPGQIHARLATDYALLSSGKGTQSTFVEPNSALILFTNWSKARMYDRVDFSEAVVQQQDAGDGDKRPGLVDYIHSQGLGGMGLPLNLFQLERDREGNHWILGCMTAQAWKSVETDLDVLNGS